MDKLIQVMQDAIRADHEAAIAEAEKSAADAPDSWWAEYYRGRARRLRAMKLPGTQP